eukprot:SAG11_NODE_2337_length_3500_cov_62.684505_3_plen_714_part_00
MTLMKVVVMVPLFALFCVGGASKSVDVVSPGLKQMWEHFDKKVSSLENDLQEEKQLRTDMQGQIDELKGRVDRCESRGKEAEESPFIRRRNLQSSVCGVEAVQSMLAVCCASDSPGNGHRLQEIEGCDTLPPTCSLECSSQFISIYENCQGEPLMEGLSAEDMSDWNEFYTDCSEVEAQSAAMMPNWMEVKMIRVSISSEGPAQPIIGPLPDLPPSPPSPDSSSTDLEQYHAQCTTANILTCVPACNSTTHGYELLATIDGTDTKFSCNLANLLFSWVGAAALGGFLGQNVAAFVSAVISGAAGTYVLTLVEDADVGSDLVVQLGQHVIISGDAELAEAPRWGSGGFIVEESGSLSLQQISLETRSPAQTVRQRGQLNLQDMILPSAIFFKIISSLRQGGRITMNTIHLMEKPDLGILTGSVSSTGGMFQFEPHDLLAGSNANGPAFQVNSGNCLAYGQCVGRPVGYLPNEHCDIVVVGGGNWPHLAPCRIFDTDGGGDVLTFTSGCNEATGNTPGSCTYSGSSCPAGVALVNGERISWDSSASYQGGDWDGADVHSVNHGGLPRNPTEAGGGWEICLVPDDAPSAASIQSTDPTFTVISGPCSVSQRGRCVGRPAGYSFSESCEINVIAGGTIGSCPAFSTCGGDHLNLMGRDYVHYPNGNCNPQSIRDECPIGLALAPGPTIAWQSVQSESIFSQRAAFGGHAWEICFKEP